MYSEDGYHALRHAAAVVRRSDRGVLTVTGSERLSWLQGLLTNDVAALAPGAAMAAAYLTPQGRMVTDLRVIHAGDRTYLDVPAALAAALRVRLDALIFAEDASVADDSVSTRIVELHGPGADKIAATISLPESLMVRDDVFGVPGFAIVVNGSDDAAVGILVDAGAIEISLETLDVIRIEAGRPAFLVDMDDQTIPLEAGLEDRAISFTKGCYVGQEVIVRVMHRGQGRVAKKLVGLLFEKSDTPHAGITIVSAEREIGRVTSATWSPALQRPIALGYVHRDFVADGTEVQIVVPSGRLSATVMSLPLVA